MFNKLTYFFKKSLSIWILLLLIVVFLSNYILSNLNLRFDGTKDKSYSLSEGTKEFLEKLEKEVLITLYYSKSHNSAPIQIKNFGNRVYDTLQEISKASNSDVSIRLIDPKPDTDEEEWAIKSGVSPNLIGGTNFFLGAILSYGKKDLTIGFIDPARERFFEYDIASKIYEVTVDKKTKIGLLSGIELASLNPNQPDQYFYSELNRIYDVVSLNYNKIAFIPEDIDLLLVIHPKDVSIHTEYAIDQYLMNGGRLAIIVDPYYRNDPINSVPNQSPQISSSTLNNIFSHWNINNNNNRILGDRDQAAIVTTQNGQIPYSLWISANPERTINDSPILANINELLFVESGGINIDSTSDQWQYTPLISSSSNTAFTEVYPILYTDPIQVSYNLTYNSGVWNLMGYFSGINSSAFEAPPEISSQDKEDQELFDELTNNRAEHINNMTIESRVLLVSDFDFINDNVSISRGNFFGRSITQMRNDNLSLFFAAISDLQGDPLLALIKPKSVNNRNFKRFQQMQLAAQTEYQQYEAQLQKQLEDLQNSISSLKPEEGSTSLNLPPETLAQIKSFQDQELETKRELREIRKLLREDVERMITWLTVINLFLAPLAMAVFGVIVYLKRLDRSF